MSAEKKAGVVVRAAEKVEGMFDGLDLKTVAKKTVVVPIKWLAIGAAVVVVLAVALSLSRQVEPYTSHLLGNPAAVVKKAK